MRLPWDTSTLARDSAETLGKGHAEYELLLRGVRWENRPVFVVSTGRAQGLAETASLLLPRFLSWPVVALSPSQFIHMALPSLRPRSAVLLLAPFGDEPALLQAARAARQMAARVMALGAGLSPDFASELDGVLKVRVDDPVRESAAALFCAHAALRSMAGAAAVIFNPPQLQMATERQELASVPGILERTQIELFDAVRFLDGHLRGKRVLIGGAGLYRPVAVELAQMLNLYGACSALAFEAAIQPGRVEDLWALQPQAVLLISGSRCAAHAAVQETALSLGPLKAPLFALTDASDQPLTRAVEFSLLLPVMGEFAGSLAALAVAEWLVAERLRQPTRRHQQTPP